MAQSGVYDSAFIEAIEQRFRAGLLGSFTNLAAENAHREVRELHRLLSR